MENYMEYEKILQMYIIYRCHRIQLLSATSGFLFYFPCTNYKASTHPPPGAIATLYFLDEPLGCLLPIRFLLVFSQLPTYGWLKTSSPLSPTYLAITGTETASEMALITSQWTGC